MQNHQFKASYTLSYHFILKALWGFINTRCKQNVKQNTWPLAVRVSKILIHSTTVSPKLLLLITFINKLIVD